MIQQKRTLLQAIQKACDLKLMAATSGNFSMRLSADRLIITPSAMPYDILTPDDLMVINLDGATISGPHRPSSEWRLHTMLYQAYPHIGAVVHTHSPYATAFAVCHMEIPPVLTEMIPFLGGNIPVAPFAIPGTADVGSVAVPYLADRNACLLANHGAVACGRNIDEALTNAIYVEDAAKIYHMARSVGQPVTLTPDILERLAQK